MSCLSFVSAVVKGSKAVGANVSEGPLGIPALPPKPELTGVGKTNTSGSSREQSEDEEGEVDTTNEQTAGVLDIKRVKR